MQGGLHGKTTSQIEEKEQQITARAEAVQGLRTRGIRSIMKAYVCVFVKNLKKIQSYN
ncbi:hypothetical protein F441_18310 [Phytophthora nicotianae CJ01A1]|uniref:Uncharacterized protein n=4 Tax=Phytophthora nicotianae TaxID=4792 RepID=V9E7W2_PHYNI|nr:hypothetical protein F443_18438 [Phytophthora nicotianae P1569]ETK75440.1 hypothetical protein L915_17940 [Phytophthora nicotianae]ETP05000.1 hypothetical protein F441_18310 [Phytophthora nicotianae CJ01A1]ETP33146.1 hypothetical protein F442_18265 [Phytophthora nicotianae P10297]ETL28873.1 hypothetical protein L916_17836 [Phytophthora nicotianae]